MSRLFDLLNRLSGTESDPEMEFYRGVFLLNTLSPREFARVREIMHERRYDPDEFIFLKGQPGAAMFIIREGAVQIVADSPDGESEMVIASLEEGEFFGELALLDNSPRSASARSVGRTRLAAIFRGDLEDLLLNEPLISSKIHRQLAIVIGERLRSTNDRLVKAWAEARREPEQMDPVT